MADHHRASLWAGSPAGSNHEAARRYSETTGVSTTGAPKEALWGPHVRDSFATHAAADAAAAAAAEPAEQQPPQPSQQPQQRE